MIPVDALLAAGFRLNAPSPADTATEADPSAAADDVDGQDAAALRADLDRIRAEHALALAEARFGQQLAEAEAGHLRAQLAERGERIADLQGAVAALTPAPERAGSPRCWAGRPCPARLKPSRPGSGRMPGTRGGAGRRGR
ncbi:hypothetical protein ADK53_33995 [Streptomyces sp. WM6373]|uniref:hypothetical protein n=1 Tax=Streptomyces sp. WM6373 TaxID=1415556 RepID=UPI0006AD8D0E|nr:hypothetical protein [Streptomyces sp. WM6373]KOU28532.1 hypothetical protein ADK53_33995 [Streptomyces sp. WM6373]